MEDWVRAIQWAVNVKESVEGGATAPPPPPPSPRKARISVGIAGCFHVVVALHNI